MTLRSDMCGSTGLGSEELQSPVRLRILSVIPGRPEGHNMIFAREAAVAIRARGAEVVEFFVESRTSPRALICDWLRLRELLREREFHIVHAQYGGVTGLLCAMTFPHIPLVLSIRGSDLNLIPSMNAARNHLTRLMTRLAALRADTIICVSEALRAQLWLGGRKSIVIPTGVDTNVFKPKDPVKAKSELGWPVGERVVMFNAGQAPEQKGLPLVTAAIERLQATGFEVRLHVTQGGHTRAEMARLLNAADCLVLASESEGSPNVVKEAMACNLPVVSVAVGDVKERLADVKPSAIVARSEVALAEGIRTVLYGGERSNGEAALRMQRLSQDDAITSLCDVYVALGTPSKNGAEVKS